MDILNQSKLLIYCLLCFTVANVYANTSAVREKQIADRLTSELHAGEAVWLGQGNTKFLGLFTETYLNQRKKAVLLLHGLGAHPDWPNVISPLRWDLPGHQLPVLSIQLPVLNPDDPVSAYGKTKNLANQRIKIAVDYLHDQGFSQVFLVGYSFGAALGAHYLANKIDHGVTAFISISILARQFLKPTINLKFLLERIDVPIIDIYASNDLDEVLRQVPDRRLAVHKNGKSSFNQVEISGPDHTYNKHIPDVIDVIIEWINQLSDEANSKLVN